jgi:hypothetical protein
VEPEDEDEEEPEGEDALEADVVAGSFFAPFSDGLEGDAAGTVEDELEERLSVR